MLDFKKFTLQRLDSFIQQIEYLNEIDFPYDDSKIALKVIENHIKSLRISLNKSILTDEKLISKCSRVNANLELFHRFLGYIAKSASPSNNFEIYFSFRRIAESILGKKVKLVINSDWESYSPINYNHPNKLKDFVFIGLPVSESENPLIVPLAGHELGHSIWTSLDISKEGISFENKYQNKIDRLRKTSYPNGGEDLSGKVRDISLIKCEEYFCDLIGLGIFGPSYLFAFAYLLAPQISREYSYSHPNSFNRANALIKASERFNYKIPTKFDKLFKIQLNKEIHTQKDELTESEQLSYKMIDDLIEDIQKILIEKNVFYSKNTKHTRIVKELLSLVPTKSARTLADITNASWEVYFVKDKWNQVTNKSKGKLTILQDLTIKSFELLEINQRLNLNDT